MTHNHEIVDINTIMEIYLYQELQDTRLSIVDPYQGYLSFVCSLT